MTIPIPDGSVVITPREMFDALQKNTAAIENLTATVDPAINAIRKDTDDNTHATAKLDRRVTVLETKFLVLAGVFGSVIAIAGIVAAVWGHG